MGFVYLFLPLAISNWLLPRTPLHLRACGLPAIRMEIHYSGLGIASGRGRRPIAPEIVEVAVALAENAARNVRSSSTERGPLRNL